jgi:hypothetical protein
MFYLYGLYDAAVGEVRYVGVTKTPRSRLAAHRTAAKKGKSKVNAWIKGVELLQLKILYETEHGILAYALESYLVREWKHLLNDTRHGIPCDVSGIFHSRSTTLVQRAKRRAAIDAALAALIGRP